MSTECEAETLRAEIAELKAEIDWARNELYLLGTRYAASHFKVQSDMRAIGIGRLRRAGAESEAAVIGQRCRDLEESIAALREVLAEAGRP